MQGQPPAGVRRVGVGPGLEQRGDDLAAAVHRAVVQRSHPELVGHLHVAAAAHQRPHHARVAEPGGAVQQPVVRGVGAHVGVQLPAVVPQHRQHALRVAAPQRDQQLVLRRPVSISKLVNSIHVWSVVMARHLESPAAVSAMLP